MSSNYDVFISYRREGGLDAARTIRNELARRGIRCFFDYNELKTGKFTEGIQNAVRNCTYFVLVLTDGSLSRCSSDANDWVRKEIELALSLGKPIIPISPSGNARGFPSDLPETMKSLCALQISQLMRDDLFDESVDKIVRERLTGLKRAAVRRWWKVAVIVFLAAVALAAGAGAWLAHQRAERRSLEAARVEREAKAEAERRASIARAESEAKAAKAKAAAEAEAAKVKAEAEARARAAEEERKRAEAAKRDEERKRAEEAEAAKEREAKLRKLAEQKAAEESRKKAEAEAAAKKAAAEVAAKEAEKARIAAAERAAAEKKAADEAAKKAAAERKRKQAEEDKKFDDLMDNL